MATVTKPSPQGGSLVPDQAADRRQVARQRQRQDVRDGQPRHGRSHRRGGRGRCRRYRPGGQGRPQGVRLRPLAEDGRPRPRPAHVSARRPDRGAHRRAGRARDARQRQADRESRSGDLPLVDRLPPLLRRLGRQDPRPDDPRSAATTSATPSASRWASPARSSPGISRMLMVAWKWGPALAAGCTVVLKPAEQTPLTRAADRRAGARGRATPRASSTSSPASARPPAHRW